MNNNNEWKWYQNLMNNHDRELTSALSELRADVRAIRETNQDIKANVSGLQQRTASLELTMTRVESNQPKKTPWTTQVMGVGALVVLGLNAPVLIAALLKGVGQ